MEKENNYNQKKFTNIINNDTKHSNNSNNNENTKMLMIWLPQKGSEETICQSIVGLVVWDIILAKIAK